MFMTVYLAAAAALFFYALLPVAGAFVVRAQWRRFRKAIVEAAGLPELGAAMLGSPGLQDRGSPDRCRAQGEVDAIGGRDELWLSCADIACVVDLRDSWVYVLTGRAGDDRIERRRWRGMSSIVPGARAFVAGAASLSGGRAVIGPSGKEAPLVILHDGDDEGLLRRAVRFGRHENEYWNPVTQVSLALGVATMSGILSLARPGRLPSLVTALTLCAAFSPMLPLLPPGVVGFFAYRRFWKRALYCRARRDVEILDNGRTPEARQWDLWAWGATAASVAAFAGSLAVNAWLAVFLFRRFL